MRSTTLFKQVLDLVPRRTLVESILLSVLAGSFEVLQLFSIIFVSGLFLESTPNNPLLRFDIFATLSIQVAVLCSVLIALTTTLIRSFCLTQINIRVFNIRTSIATDCWQALYELDAKIDMSEKINILGEKLNTFIFNAVHPIFIAGNSLIIALVLMVALFMVNPLVVAGFCVCAILLVILVIYPVANRLAAVSAEINSSAENSIRSVVDVHNFKLNVKQLGAKTAWAERFDQLQTNYSHELNVKTSYVGLVRIFIEGGIIFTILSGLYFASVSPGVADIGLATLVPVAFGFLRVLPLFTTLASLIQGFNASRNQIEGIAATLASIVGVEVSDREAVAQMSSPSGVLNLQEIRVTSGAFSIGDDFTLKVNEFRLQKGRINVVRGPTGAGKSQLCNNLIQRHLVLDCSSSTVVSADLAFDNKGSEDDHALFYSMPQSGRMAFMSVEENVTLLAGELKKGQLDSLLNTVCFRESELLVLDSMSKERDFSGLSGGQVQRLELARAVYSQKPILIMDEPTSALDHETSETVWQLLSDLAQDRFVIVITHDEAIPKDININTIKVYAGEVFVE